MTDLRSVYMVEPYDHGWIIERLMRDLTQALSARGVNTRIGPADGYAGETAILNSRYLTPFASPQAKINALFVTHVDDRLREYELQRSFKAYNSLICISDHDAEFVAALRGDPGGVVGINLPARDTSVRPMRIAVFSAFYDDGRKNEAWIQEYFARLPQEVRDNFIVCFLGWGWEPFCATLGKLEMNYELYRYSRFTPGEYDRYRQVLAGMDKLICVGFDGGAMCVYDAISVGIGVIAPNISYHRGLGGAVTLFDDKQGFFRELDRLQAVVAERQSVLRARSTAAYADQLIAHWTGLLQGGGERQPEPVAPDAAETIAGFRSHYKPVDLSRLRSAAIRFVQNLGARK